jgi:UDPglucose 6-dehydrogenase
MQISFIGLGKLGLPCAEAIAQKGHTVKGYDVIQKESHLVDVVESIKDCVTDTDIVFIAVPTPHDPLYDGRAPTAHLEPKDFSYDIVKTCLAEANKHMNKGQLLVLISTVLPGTTRREFIHLVTNTRFVYNPYLIAMGSVAWDMVNPEMVIVGTRDGSETGDAKTLIDFYKPLMQNDPRYVVGTWDEAESIKIFYNTFISTKIGLVNMIQDVAMKNGNINVDVVTDALAHSTTRIMSSKYMTAGMGDAGPCHPRDNIALRWLAENLQLGYDIFDTVMSAREQQAKNLARYLKRLQKDVNLPIYILGKAYKPDVDYEDGSYSLLIGHYLESMQAKYYYIDPLTGDDPPFTGMPVIAFLAHNRQVTYGYAGDQPEQELYVDLEPGSVIVDPWRQYRTQKDYRVIHYGNTRLV